jgi:transcriptional regulator with XRE-family HTH domain
MSHTETDSVPKKLGSNIRKQRSALDFSQERLAEKSGLDQTYISGIERGKRNPGIKNDARIAKALGIKTTVLVEGVEE